jgi:hypothetical protein
MQGKKDFKTAVNNGNEQSVQKELLMFDLIDLYRSFKVKYLCDELGFSEFADFRTQRCDSGSTTRKRAVSLRLTLHNINLVIDGLNTAGLNANRISPT